MNCGASALVVIKCGCEARSRSNVYYCVCHTPAPCPKNRARNPPPPPPQSNFKPSNPTPPPTPSPAPPASTTASALTSGGALGDAFETTDFDAGLVNTTGSRGRPRNSRTSGRLAKASVVMRPWTKALSLARLRSMRSGSFLLRVTWGGAGVICCAKTVWMLGVGRYECHYVLRGQGGQLVSGH